MSELFGVNISGIIADEIGPGVFDAVLIQTIEGARTSSTSGRTVTENPIAGRGFVDMFDTKDIDGQNVKSEDVKVVLIADTFPGLPIPKTGDKVSILGNVYRILDRVTDPASATHTCHSRK